MFMIVNCQSKHSNLFPLTNGHLSNGDSTNAHSAKKALNYRLVNIRH